jgi:hypothetical protein
MITEKHNFALMHHTPTEVELLTDVVYESASNVPFQGVGFDTMEELEDYMALNNLNFYEPQEELV